MPSPGRASRSASAPATPVVARPRSQAVSRAFVQELQEVEIPTGHLVGRGPEEDQEAERAGPDIRAL